MNHKLKYPVESTQTPALLLQVFEPQPQVIMEHLTQALQSASESLYYGLEYIDSSTSISL